MWTAKISTSANNTKLRYYKNDKVLLKMAFLVLLSTNEIQRQLNKGINQ